MPDDYGQEYLNHRVQAEQESGPLADFLRQNAEHFVESPAAAAPVPTPGTSPPVATQPSTFRKVLDYTAFLVRPLGALQEAAIAPIAHDYTKTGILDQAGEALAVSGKALMSSLFPTPPGDGGSRPAYEQKIIERNFPDMPESLKPAAETFLGVVTDPAVLAFPFMKSVRAGLEVRAAQKGDPGPWRRALEEAVSFGPTRDEEAARLAEAVDLRVKPPADQQRLATLADAADAGDAKAAQTLVSELAAEPEARKQLDEILGKADGPLVTPVDEATATRFLQSDRVAGDIPTHAVNINLARVNAAEDVQTVLEDTAKLFAGSIDEARRGAQTNAATQALADSMGMTPETLLARRSGQAFNAEEALAARDILVSSAESLRNTALKALAPNAGDLDKVAFRKQLALHKAIQDQVSGLTAEAGRALQQFNIAAKSTKEQMARIKELTEAMANGDTSIDDMARAVADFNTPEQMAEFARNIDRATTKDVFFEVWINALLSGLQTHAVNTISNSLVALWQVPERFLASGISKALGSGEEGVMATEAVGQAFGLIEGFKDGLKAFARTVATEVPVDVVGKLEVPGSAAISGEALGMSGNLGRAMDYLGRGVRMPGTLLTAEDAFFKSIGYRMELHARAFRQAAEEGLTGQAAAHRVAEVLANPPPDIHMAAIDAARYQTFTKSLGKTGQAVQRVIASQPALRIIVPFVRTPTNIFKFFVERSPFAPLTKSFRADIKAGGARRDLALARISMGTGVMMTAATLAAEGRVTGGGPVDPELRGLKYNTGWQPYSIKVGDQYIAYGRLEPLGTLLGVAADFSEIAGELEESDAQDIVAHLAMATAQNVTNKTFLRGISEAINALDDPVRYGERWWMNFAGTAVPTGVAQIARVQDPILRETRTVMDRYRSRIPGYSQDLPPRRNIWGEPIQLSGGLGPDIVSPFYVSKKKDDPVSEELLRLEIPVTQQERTVSGVELTPQQYDRLLLLTGKEPITEGELPLREALQEVINDPDYKDLSDGPDGDKVFALRRVISRYKSAARAKLIEEDSELRRLVEQRFNEE